MGNPNTGQNFERRFPDLIPTNMPGVFTTPAPPDGFDVRTASWAERETYGLNFSASPEDEPSLVARLSKLFPRPLRAEDRIVPRLEPREGKTHVLKGARQAETGYSSDNWSGSVLLPPAVQWMAVTGDWIIPTISQPSEPAGAGDDWDSSTWVGLNGWNSHDVFQTGTQQVLYENGTIEYVAWFEWWTSQPSTPPYPYRYQTNFSNLPVSPGQNVHGFVWYLLQSGGWPQNMGNVFFLNWETSAYVNLYIAPPPGVTMSGVSAEWIMEAPNGGYPNTVLPQFTPVQFTSAISTDINYNMGNPQGGNFVNIVNGSQVLTSVDLALQEATITFMG